MIGGISEDFSPEERNILANLDSLQFGFLKLSSQEELGKKAVIIRAIECLEKKIKVENESSESDELDPRQSNVTEIFCTLGHLNLLIEDFGKALSAYQKYYALQKDNWKDSAFLYGLGITYFHYGAYQWATRAFQHLLYTFPDFLRGNEVHIRLGLMFKSSAEYDSSLKHFSAALNDSSPCSLSKYEVKFHIAHVLELQGKHRRAKESYEQLVDSPDIPALLKSNSLRQLGWMYHSNESLGDVQSRESMAINYLRKSIDVEPTSGQSWYFLGRCLSSVGKVHDAFVSYRHSIDKSEASADTWCSIGVLYQQQNQHMDALQAYICAVQLDRSHSAAWTDLGILYESCAQPKDALVCYNNALSTAKGPANPNVTSRIKLLQQHLKNIPSQYFQTKAKTLPSIEEAWSLPIPAELTSRQGANNMGRGSAPTTSAAHRQQTTAAPGSTMQQQLTPGGPRQFPSGDGPEAKRARLGGDGKEVVPYLTPHELQTLNHLQQNQGNLNPQQLQLMQHLQQQLLLQQRQQQQNSITSNSQGNASNALGQGVQSSQGIFTSGSSSKPSEGSITDGSLGRDEGNGSSKITESSARVALAPRTVAEEVLARIAQEQDSQGGAKDSLGRLSDVQPWVKIEEGDEGEKMDVDGDDRKDIDKNKENHDLDLKEEEENQKNELRINMSAAEVITFCKTQDAKSPVGVSLYNSLISDSGPPPGPPNDPTPVLSKDRLNPATPSVYLESKKDAFSIELQQYCMAQQLCVVRGLAVALKLDLSLFSTRTLVEANPDHPVEIRTQRQQTPDENVDQAGNRVWKCDSSRSYTNIAKYAQYQAMSFQESFKEEHDKSKAGRERDSDSDSNSSAAKSRKKQSMIKFGTNVDLSDEKKWKSQLQELGKLPSFVRVVSGSNMLSHIGQTILGMNSVQLYMKVPGSRTPGHQENNNFCSVNINIGPGDSEWFAVPESYWGTIQRLCEKNGINYLKGSWWPSIDDLFDNNVPVYRFIQKPGDLVWLGPGTIHWVQAIGWCNNIAWNIGPLTWRQYELAVERYEYNRVETFKSIVPVIHLSWTMARNLQITDPKLFEMIRRTLQRTLCRSIVAQDLATSQGKSVVYHGPPAEGEAAPYCDACENEVFNTLFVLDDDKKRLVHCANCAKKISPTLTQFIVLEQFKIEDLMIVYDSFQLGSIPQKNSESWLSW